MSALGLAFAAAIRLAACHPVDGPKILGRHLAAADPAFQALPADLAIGYAPAPGARRTLHVYELRRLAKTYGAGSVSAETVSNDLCFEWPMALPDERKLSAAMLQTLDTPGTGDTPGTNGAKVEVVETSRYPIPPGPIRFPRSGLLTSDAGDITKAVVWRGYVEYAENRKVSIWARVKIAVPSTRVTAAKALPPGEAIRPEDLRLEEYWGPPGKSRTSGTIPDLAGLIPRRPLREGETIVPSLLEQPKVVKRGQTVEVSVASESVHFRTEGLAESAGRIGDAVLVRNVTSGKRFRATVESPGKVRVQTARGRADVGRCQ